MKRRNLYAKAVTRIRPQVVPDKLKQALDSYRGPLSDDWEEIDALLTKERKLWEKAQSPFKQSRIATETGEREDV